MTQIISNPNNGVINANWPDDIQQAKDDPVAACYDAALLNDYGWRVFDFVLALRTYRLMGFKTLAEAHKSPNLPEVAAKTRQLTSAHIICDYNLKRHLQQFRVVGEIPEMEWPIGKLLSQMEEHLYAGLPQVRHKLEKVVPILDESEWHKVGQLKFCLERLWKFIEEDKSINNRAPQAC